jgi:hypothetical protein
VAQVAARIGVDKSSPVVIFDRSPVQYTMDSPDLEREIVGLFMAQL